MKRILPYFALLILFAASSVAQIRLPNRPSGVVTANRDVVTRDGSNNYLLYAPVPLYPDAAARQGISGRGVFIADLSLLYGTVDDVRVLTSTGSQVLDEAAKAALSQWVFRHYTVYKAAIPVAFDASGRVRIGADPEQGPYISAILANMNLVPQRNTNTKRLRH
jgi:TonB family protein